MKLKKHSGIDVFLIDDHHIVRAGIKSELAKYGHINYIGEAAGGIEALKKLDEIHPDVILLDISMPDMNGIDAAEKILQKNPDARIIILSMHNSYNYISKMFKIGVMGYLFKDCEPDELVKAIDTVHFGSAYYCKAINKDELRKISEQYQKARLGDKDPKLTRREIDILLLMVEGCSNKEISKKLSISVRTVETHREHIQQKLNIKNLAKLTQYAYQKGYIELKTESF